MENSDLFNTFHILEKDRNLGMREEAKLFSKKLIFWRKKLTLLLRYIFKESAKQLIFCCVICSKSQLSRKSGNKFHFEEIRNKQWIILSHSLYWERKKIVGVQTMLLKHYFIDDWFKKYNLSVFHRYFNASFLVI